MSSSLSPTCRSLQDICLESIVDHFEKYCTAYASNAYPSRCLKFLQRRFSKCLVEKLHSRNEIKDEYLDFLINRHSKENEFDLDFFRTCSWSVIERRLLDIGDTVIKLVLSQCSKSSEKLFLNFGKLETLVLSTSNCSDETLAVIGKQCPILKLLDVQYCNITNEGLKNLFVHNTKGCALLSLNVRWTEVDKAGIEFVLQNIPSLEVIDHEDVYVPQVLYNMHKNIGKNCLTEVKKYNIRTLDFDSFSFAANELSVCATVCPHITSLYAYDLNNDHLYQCTKFSKLESIILSGAQNDTDQVFAIDSFLEAGGKRLKNLKLSNFSLSPSVLARSCPKLEILKLNFIHFRNIDENNLLPMNFLQSFSLSSSVFDNQDTQTATESILAASPNIRYLRLSYFQACEKELDMSIWKCLKFLKLLELNWSNIKLPFLETFLLSNSSIESLIIYGCENIGFIEYRALLNKIQAMGINIAVEWHDWHDLIL